MSSPDAKKIGNPVKMGSRKGATRLRRRRGGRYFSHDTELRRKRQTFLQAFCFQLRDPRQGTQDVLESEEMLGPMLLFSSGSAKDWNSSSSFRIVSSFRKKDAYICWAHAELYME